MLSRKCFWEIHQNAARGWIAAHPGLFWPWLDFVYHGWWGSSMGVFNLISAYNKLNASLPRYTSHLGWWNVPWANARESPGHNQGFRRGNQDIKNGNSAPWTAILRRYMDNPGSWDFQRADIDMSHERQATRLPTSHLCTRRTDSSQTMATCLRSGIVQRMANIKWVYPL